MHLIKYTFKFSYREINTVAVCSCQPNTLKNFADWYDVPLARKDDHRRDGCHTSSYQKISQAHARQEHASYDSYNQLKKRKNENTKLSDEHVNCQVYQC